VCLLKFIYSDNAEVEYVLYFFLPSMDRDDTTVAVTAFLQAERWPNNELAFWTAIIYFLEKYGLEKEVNS
jgi:hypothetical protein